MIERRPCRSMVEPLLNLGEGNQDPTATADSAELVDHVLVQVVTADTEKGGCLVWTEREPGTGNGR